MFDLTIHQKDLSRLLERAASAAAVKSPVSSLMNVLLEAKDGVLTARATNSYISVDTRVSATVKTAGSVAVAAKAAAEFAKQLPAGEVRLRVVKNHVEVTSGKSSKSKLPALPGEHFPELPRVADGQVYTTVKAADLVRAISQGTCAMADDDTRPHLHGALFEPAKGLVHVVSADGHRLALGSADVDGAFPKMFVPYRAVADVSKLCAAAKDGNVRVAYDREVAFFVTGDTTLSLKTGDMAFPPWEKLIPQKPAHRLQLPKSGIVDAIKRVRLFADDKFTIKLTFSEGVLRISAQSEKGESDEALDCACDFDLTMGIHSDYLKDAFDACLDDEVNVELVDALGPFVIAGGGYTAVCMPIRL